MLVHIYTHTYTHPPYIYICTYTIFSFGIYRWTSKHINADFFSLYQMLQPSRTLFAEQRRWCRGPCICPRYDLEWFLWTSSNQFEWKLPDSHNVSCASPTHLPGLFIICKKGTSFVLSPKICQCTVSASGLLQKCTLEEKESKMIEMMSIRTGSKQLELATGFENGGKGTGC